MKQTKDITVDITVNVPNDNKLQRLELQAVLDKLAAATGQDARAKLENLDLSGYSFEGKRVVAADFVGCDLSGVNFRNAILQGSTFTECKMDGADFEGADLRWSSLSDEPQE